MGAPSRTSHYDSIWQCQPPRTLQVPRLPQYCSIALCSLNRLSLPTLGYQGIESSSNNTKSPNSRATIPSGCHLLVGISLRLCISRAYRLHHIHSRQVLQASPRYVLAHNSVSKTIPIVQIPRRSGRYLRCCSLYPPRWLLKSTLQALKSSYKPRQEQCMGPLTPGHQFAV